jgi:flagellar motor switch protein FliG
MRLKDKLDAYKKGTSSAGEVRKAGCEPSKGSAPDAMRPKGGLKPGPSSAGTKAPSDGDRGRSQAAGAAKAEGMKPPKGLDLGSFLKTGSGEPAYRKAAKLLLLIGKDEAAEVLSRLDPEDAERIGAEIATVRRIHDEEARLILGEFGERIQEASRARGGIEAAEDILVRAFGYERARKILSRVSPERGPRHFEFLEDLEEQQVQMLLKDESIPVIALVLARLDPAFASKILSRLPEAERKAVALRIAKAGKVAPETLESIAMALREKARRQGKVVTEELDGTESLAAILRFMDPEREEDILASLDDAAPDASRRVREKLFTLEDILDVPPKMLQDALRAFKDKELALILKGKPPEFRDCVYANIPEGRRALLRDEEEVLGPARKGDVDNATRNLIAWFKRKYDEGELVLLSRGEEYIE